MALVGKWYLAENTYENGVFLDSSGNSNSGTPANAPVFVPDSFGRANAAMVFDGSTDLINVGNVATLDVDFGALTLCGWIKKENTDFGVIVGKNIIWYLAIISDTSLFLRHSNIGDSSTLVAVPSLGNIYHHVAGVLDGTTSFVYLDGQYVGGESAIGTTGVNSAKVGIGVIDGSGSNKCELSLSNVQIYNTALSPTEINAIYLQGYSGFDIGFSSGFGITKHGFSLGFSNGFGLPRTWNRYFTGSATPAGAVGSIPTFVVGLSGSITPAGRLTGQDPAWLLIPDYLNWQGNWIATTSYERDDVTLYQDGDLIHAFVSKTGHNVGNIPTTAYQHWTRLVQEKWNI